MYIYRKWEIGHKLHELCNFVTFYLEESILVFNPSGMNEFYLLNIRANTDIGEKKKKY